MTYRYKTRDLVKNYDFAEAVSLVQNYLRDGFHAATLFTTASIYITMEKKRSNCRRRNRPRRRWHMIALKPG